MSNKNLYNKILNGNILSQNNDIVESLGYPIVDSTETNAYLGSNALLKAAWCEDTVDVPNSSHFSASVLIIGGGGGGGYSFGGGGGAGGYREFTKKYFTGINYTVTVGAGGAGGTSLKGANGNNSSIERIATGGGGGGGTGSTEGQDGGSGGGASNGGTAGSSTDPRCNGSSQGNSGNSSGGGGGAGAAATDANGGDGSSSSITGSSVTRGGGGGGGPNGTGGAGGGGDGRNNGTVNTGGGGGGGGGVIQSPQEGGNGGSGLVVLKFPDSYSITIGGGLTYTSSTSGGYTTVQFTAGTDTIEFFWNPASISGLELWLDADDSETITLNATTVSSWNDKSGNGYNVSQGTASYQPTYSTAQLNGRNVVTFDGNNDHILNDSLASVASGNDVPITMFVVFKQLSSGTNEYGVVFGSSSSIQPLFCMMTNSNQLAAQQRTDAGTLTAAYSSVSSTSAYRVQSIVLSSSNLTVYNNGTSVATSSFTPAQTSFDTFTIGAWRRSGSMNGVAFLHCDIAEVIIYNSALSTSDRNSVEDYLSSKWGIS